jgi:dTDP-glucose 4,6-dehydratase
MKALVTGGLGFIGKHFIKKLLDNNFFVVNVDKTNYCSDLFFEKKYLKINNKYNFIYKDIKEIDYIDNYDYIFHFAAESHVDNSIDGSQKFIQSNIFGTQNLLELVRNKPKYDRPMFVHISTDEVYGDIVDGFFIETDRLNPSNPYSATKASAEHLVTSWNRTYDLDYLIFRPSNNYGFRQYPEKFIPKSISRLSDLKKIIIHGNGSYVRTWTHVEDTCNVIYNLSINSTIKNEIYNVSSGQEFKNIDIAKMIYSSIKNNDDFYNNIYYVDNRKGQDIRYGISNKKSIDCGVNYTMNIEEEIKKISKEKLNWIIC